nr:MULTISPECIES: hypothetical protein [unclassified Burkholderia]
MEATTSAVAAAIFDFAERDDFERPRAISDAAHQVLVEAFHTTRYDLFIRTFPLVNLSATRIEFAQPYRCDDSARAVTSSSTLTAFREEMRNCILRNRMNTDERSCRQRCQIARFNRILKAG